MTPHRCFLLRRILADKKAKFHGTFHEMAMNKIKLLQSHIATFIGPI